MTAKIHECISVHIRWMIRRDMPEVLSMENTCFPSNAWTEEDFLTSLRQRNCIGMIAERGDKVVGYMIYELEKTHLHVLNFGVEPIYWRAGIGTQMMAKLIAKLSNDHRTAICLDVREGNLPAQCFFRALGFKAQMVYRNFYPAPNSGDGEDAYHMVYTLAGCEQQQEPLFSGQPVNRVAQFYSPPAKVEPEEEDEEPEIGGEG